jgi:hypothetical protein
MILYADTSLLVFEPWSDQSKSLSSSGLTALNPVKTGLWLAFGACFLISEEYGAVFGPEKRAMNPD